jgi:hypothetical protein
LQSLKIGDLEQQSMSLRRDIGHMSALLGRPAAPADKKYSSENVMGEYCCLLNSFLSLARAASFVL